MIIKCNIFKDYSLPIKRIEVGFILGVTEIRLSPKYDKRGNNTSLERIDVFFYIFIPHSCYAPYTMNTQIWGIIVHKNNN